MMWVDRAPVARRIERWWNDPDAPRLLVVSGRFGTGKSVVLAQTVDRIRTHPDTLLLARMRLRGSSRVLARSDLSSMVAEIDSDLGAVLGTAVVHSIASPSNSFTMIVEAGHVDEVHLPGMQDLRDADLQTWNGSVVPRLEDAIFHGLRPVLVVDALDELDQELVSALTRTIIPELPAGVRVIVSGRPDLPVALVAPGCATPEIVDLDDPDLSPDQDIARYALDRLRDRLMLDPSLRDQLVEQIVANADGKFLYARWVLDDLVSDPDVDLADWRPPQGMASLYNHFLGRLQVEAGDRWPMLAEVLASIASSLDPGLSVGELGELHDLDVPVVRSWLRTWCRHYVEIDARDRVRVGHVSLAVHWVGTARSDSVAHGSHLQDVGALGVDPSDVQARLAHWCADRPWDAGAPEYAVRNAVAHAVAATAGERDDGRRRAHREFADRLVLSWSWCVQRHDRHGLGALLSDLDRVLALTPPSIRPVPTGAGDVAMVRRTLTRAQHRFGGLSDGCSFLAQLHYELALSGASRLADGVGRELKLDTRTWLRLRWSTEGSDERVEQTVSYHAGEVKALATTAGGRVISATDREIVAFDSSVVGEDGYEELWEGFTVTPLVASLSGERVAVGLGDGRRTRIMIRDLDRAMDQFLVTTEWLVALAWSGELLVGLAASGDVRTWTVDDERGLLTSTVQSGPYSAMAVDRAGRVALARAGTELSAVEVWTRLTDGDRLAAIEPLEVGAGARPITALAWLADGRLALGCSDGTLALRNVSSGGNGDWDGVAVAEGRVRSIVGLSDGSMVTLCDEHIASWSQVHSTHVWRIDAVGNHPVRIGELPRTATALGTTRDGRLVTGHQTGDVAVWSDLSASSLTPGRYQPPAWGLASLDRRTVVTGHEDGTLRVWDVETGELQQEIAGTGGGRITQVAAGVGRLICFTDEARFPAVLRRTGERWSENETQDSFPLTSDALCVLPGGRLVVCNDSGVHLSGPRRWNRARLLDHPAGLDLPKVTAACAVSRRLVATGHEDGSVRIWRTTPSIGLLETHWSTPEKQRVWRLCAFEDGLVVSSHVDGSIVIWHPGSEVVVIDADPVSVLAVIDDGHFVVGDADGLHVFTRAGDLVAGIRTASVTGLASTPSGVVACHEDGGLSAFAMEWGSSASSGTRSGRTGDQ